ncbi:MAG: phosphate ABC transporter permease subunit PstC [Thermomicrobiales bacterium]|nr:phosphate ABC transporter permease subunit PstC [Thermomicrobiales bacterium]
MTAQSIGLTGSGRRQTSERIIGALLFICGSLSVLTTVGIILTLLEQAVEFFVDVSIIDFLTGTEWTALFANGEFGVLPLVNATLLIALLSMCVAIPLGLMAAIYLSEYASHRVRSVLKPFLELLAGIPTIVYGYFALTFITPEILQPLLPGTKVYNVLSASIAVGIMVLPMVASLSEDALRAVPNPLREAAYGVGATKFEVSTRVVVPAALSGIVASMILAISRAVGETMIVALASGLKAQIVFDPREGAQAMTSYIVQVVSGDVVSGSTVYKSLFAVGLLLFLITLGMNIVSQWFVAKFREEYQ